VPVLFFFSGLHGDYHKPSDTWDKIDSVAAVQVLQLVAEVAYDHLQGDRFRHATSFKRWRADRTPESCTYAQLDTPLPTELAEVFGIEG